MKLKLIFAWYDFWIGAFYDKKKKWLYLFPIPMLGIIIMLPTKMWVIERLSPTGRWHPIMVMRDKKKAQDKVGDLVTNKNLPARMRKRYYENEAWVQSLNPEKPE